jgi:ornithine decarboxylase
MAPSALTTTEQYQFSLKDSIQSVNYHLIGSAENHGASKSKQLIGEALKSRVEAIDHDTCNVGEEDAFFVADLGEVYRQHMRWKKNLARVKPHYGEFPRAALTCSPLTIFQPSSATRTRKSFAS